jgi:polyribonucleotide nucleotidyltransferase
LAKQSDGSALLQSGGTVILSTVVVDEMTESNEDFLPLTVQYIEKVYAVGKFPSGFIKREGKPSDFETLTSRIVDRALRPLFPKGFNYPVQITIMVLSVDENADLQTLALRVASASLFVSNLPVRKSVSGVRIGKINNKFIIDPNSEERNQSSLDLFVAGTKEELLMIEMRSVATFNENIQNSNVIPENELLEAIALAETELTKQNIAYEQNFTSLCRDMRDLKLRIHELPTDLVEFVAREYYSKLEDSLKQLSQSERATVLIKLANEIKTRETNIDEVVTTWEMNDILEALQKHKRKIMRSQILETGIRADGRGLRDVRPISIETNILPQVHGSCLFTRGQTQALVTLTIGSDEDAQIFEELTKVSGQQEQFMVHYNFPGFSVGEASRMKSVGRRELGHGNLAKRALESSLINSSGMTLRLVSEILESNGSSSMATVCGGAIALKAGGILTSDLISGVAMGLITEADKYAVLTDIMGLEDHDGDMDFKVTGTRNGITAMQMDIKLGGIKREVLSNALEQAKEARSHILNIMETAISKISVNHEILPKIETFKINPTKVVDVIGQGGKNIKAIIDGNNGVKIDINRETGEIKVVGRKIQNVENAVMQIRRLGDDRNPKELYPVGTIYNVSVKQIAPFGAFVELPFGHDGMIHISKIAKNRVTKIEDHIKIGDKIRVEVLAVDGKKIELQKIDNLIK